MFVFEDFVEVKIHVIDVMYIKDAIDIIVDIHTEKMEIEEDNLSIEDYVNEKVQKIDNNDFHLNY